jgi:hypothetical protein
MKKLLIGLTLLTSMSSFASCIEDYANVKEPTTKETIISKITNEASIVGVVKVKETILEAYVYQEEMESLEDYDHMTLDLIQGLTERIVEAIKKSLLSDYVVDAIIKADKERDLCDDGTLGYDSFVSTVIKHMKY